ncbi:hypothetical protein V8N76_004545 [Salmonella enterica]
MAEMTLSRDAMEDMLARIDMYGHGAGYTPEEVRALLVQCLNAPQAPEGWLAIPSVPSAGHLASIAMRLRHDFGLLEGTERDSTLATARQMYEECSGQGFYQVRLPR